MRGRRPALLSLALAAFVVTALAGCMDEEPAGPFTSEDAIAMAAEVLAEHPGAVLTHLQATHGGDETRRTWYEDRGFHTDLPEGDVLTGRSHQWVLGYLLPPAEGHLPATLLVEVTREGVAVKEFPSREIGEGFRGQVRQHDRSDVCLMRADSTARFAELAMMENVTDSATVAAAYAVDPALEAFLPTATSWSMYATGAKGRYGNVDEWGWCWEVDRTWEVEVERDDGAKWIGVYALDGTRLYDVNWTDGKAGRHEAHIEETFTEDPLQYGEPQTRTYPFEVGEEARWLVLYNSTSTPHGATDVQMWVTAPDGTVHDFQYGYEIRIAGPDAGTWTLTYEYTPGPTLLGTLPLPQDHHVDVGVWYQGYAPA